MAFNSTGLFSRSTKGGPKVQMRSEWKALPAKKDSRPLSYTPLEPMEPKGSPRGPAIPGDWFTPMSDEEKTNAERSHWLWGRPSGRPYETPHPMPKRPYPVGMQKEGDQGDWGTFDNFDLIEDIEPDREWGPNWVPLSLQDLFEEWRTESGNYEYSEGFARYATDAGVEGFEHWIPYDEAAVMGGPRDDCDFDFFTRANQK